jgi:C-terminal processing protease CtpA/Prc
MLPAIPKRRRHPERQEGQYRKAKTKGECPNTKAAVLIDGKSAGGSSIFARTRNAM